MKHTQRALMIAATAFAFINLTGCVERVRIATPPPELLTCEAMPPAPELPSQTAETQRVRDELVLAYIMALRVAYGDCAGNLAGVKAWADEVE